MRTSKSSAIRNTILGLIIMLMPLACGLLLIAFRFQGWASADDVNLLLGVAALVVTIYVAIFTGFLSWRTLIIATLPRIRIEYLGESNTKRKVFHSSETVTIRFSLSNIGWWYAKPASTNTKLYLNLDPSFNPEKVYYGSNLELTESQFLRGKRNSKYFIVRGIHLYAGEADENVEIQVGMPDDSGKYPIWITARSDECDYGTFNYEIQVESVVKSDN